LRGSRLVVLGLLAPLLAAPPAGAWYSLVERDGTVYVTDAAEQPSAPGPASSPLGAVDGVPEPYGDLIRDIAARHDVPDALVVSVIRAESAFNPRAVSPKGARGLMQLMPDTAAQLGVGDPFDPRQNIDGGVRHLRNLLWRFGGDVRLAVAAYNAGAAAVNQHRGVPPIAETTAYVERVLGFYRMGEQLALPAPEQSDSAADPRRLDRYETADGAVMYTNLAPAWLPAGVRAQRLRQR
jgi:soluble lytic murein transglycosylase-like protein